jgi:hypothetical protein
MQYSMAPMPGLVMLPTQGSGTAQGVPCKGVVNGVCGGGMYCYAEGTPQAACIKQGMLGAGNPMGGGSKPGSGMPHVMPEPTMTPGCENGGEKLKAEKLKHDGMAKSHGCEKFMQVRTVYSFDFDPVSPSDQGCNRFMSRAHLPRRRGRCPSLTLFDLTPPSLFEHTHGCTRRSRLCVVRHARSGVPSTETCGARHISLQTVLACIAHSIAHMRLRSMCTLSERVSIVF